ncbi:2'-5' RNA ligase family protein [Crenalkalicoccus roseus]|uniref:2'-5' RNA ligase family protein n=1 Tax=Crenalkalicoccus roseus TaxID=1485588 RepID=UPI001081B729|nr:2'-5' RNA ligase family protein [Crenalkalicoccus roseus]
MRPCADAPPLILTLALDADAMAWLEALRQAHFPPGRTLVPAHVTLFHALPGGEEARIRAALAAACATVRRAPATLGPPLLLGRGVALAVAAPEVAALRARLAEAWRPWLTAQDRQGWRPHATVQNKVAPEAARALHARLSAMLPPRRAMTEALLLWRYRGGPWEAAGRFALA